MWQVLKNAKSFQLGALNSKLHLFSCWNAGEWAGKEWTGHQKAMELGTKDSAVFESIAQLIQRILDDLLHEHLVDLSQTLLLVRH